MKWNEKRLKDIIQIGKYNKNNYWLIILNNNYKQSISYKYNNNNNNF